MFCGIIFFRALKLFSGYSDSIGLAVVFFSLIINYKYILSSFKVWIFIFYLIFFLSTIVTTVFNFLDGNNNWAYNLLPILLTIPLFYFFNKLHDSAILKKFNRIYTLLYFLSAIIFWENIFQINLNPFFYLLFSFYILINSVGYLYEEMTLMRSRNVFYKIEFWFLSCLFFYAIICVIVWSLFSYLENNKLAQEEFMHPGYLWAYCHNTILFIQSFVFSIAIFKIASRK